jgi:hypothetical protein
MKRAQLSLKEDKGGDKRKGQKVCQERLYLNSRRKGQVIGQTLCCPQRGPQRGGSGLCVVFHAGANKLNDCIWAPFFTLSLLNSLLRIVNWNSLQEDRDMGEMFLNSQLDPKI